MKPLLAPILALTLIAAGPAPAAPDWMAGSWIQTEGARWADEYWTLMRGGVMIGASRSGKGDVLSSWEHTRIERSSDGGLVYLASPHGRPAIAFKMVKSDAASIEFANPAHDYPQRIRYWRDGKQLNAEISLADGSKPMRWAYRLMVGD